MKYCLRHEMNLPPIITCSRPRRTSRNNPRVRRVVHVLSTTGHIYNTAPCFIIIVTVPWIVRIVHCVGRTRVQIRMAVIVHKGPVIAVNFQNVPYERPSARRRETIITTRGAKNWAFLEPRAASKRHFVVSSSGLSGLHPALPPMAESLGALSSTKFDGEIIENEKRGC
jgi:hypothetical protein